MDLGLIPLEERIVLDAAVAMDMGGAAAGGPEAGENKAAVAAGLEAGRHELAAAGAIADIRASLGIDAIPGDVLPATSKASGESCVSDPRFSEYADTMGNLFET